MPLHWAGDFRGTPLEIPSKLIRMGRRLIKPAPPESPLGETQAGAKAAAKTAVEALRGLDPEAMLERAAQPRPRVIPPSIGGRSENIDLPYTPQGLVPGMPQGGLRSSRNWKSGAGLPGEMTVPDVNFLRDDPLERPDANFPRSDPLEGLRASQFKAPPYQSTEELYRQAFASPETVAPGASAKAKQQLSERLGEEQFGESLQRKQLEAISGALTAEHPAVLAQKQREAEFAAYPAEAQAFAAIEAAESRAGQAMQEAILAMLQGNQQAQLKAMTELMDVEQDLLSTVTEYDWEPRHTELLGRIRRFPAALQALPSLVGGF